MELLHRLYPKEPVVMLKINEKFLHGDFIVMEYYCANPACDCNDGLFQIRQRFFFGLLSRRITEIRYSFQKPLSTKNPNICYDYDYNHSFDSQKSLVCLLAFKQNLTNEPGLIDQFKKHYHMVRTFQTSDEFLNNTYLFNKQIKTGRNDLCFCGSGKKYKKCCMQNTPSSI